MRKFFRTIRYYIANMNIPINLDQLYYTQTIITLILFITSFLLNPIYSELNIVVDKKKYRTVTNFMILIFVISTSIKLAYEIIILF